MAPVFSQLVQPPCPTGSWFQLARLPSSRPALEAPKNLLPVVQRGIEPNWLCQGAAQRVSSSIYLFSLLPKGRPLKERFSPSHTVSCPPLHSLPTFPKAVRWVTGKGGAYRVASLSTDSTESRPIRRTNDKKKAQSDFSSLAPPGPSKTCEQCMRAKPVADFERTSGSQDGRSEWCRACMAVFEAERWKRKMHHLALSVEEAWERGKQCTECGLFKELRDFPRNARLIDGVGHICRGCRSDMYYALPRRPSKRPSNEPQECTFCHESKPASEFFKRKDGRRGLHSHCKSCIAERRDELTRDLQSREVVRHVPKMTKRCSVCMEIKPTTEFFPRLTSNDGLMRDCKVCKNAEKRKWRLDKKLTWTEGATAETTQEEGRP